jgi:glycosyltransferase involved in cell wall biosynthesis
MKIALIGNTLNNNFSLMRYLRDLGVDAHLLLYANEGIESCNPLYSPEWDTWNYSKWKEYIHRMPINNGIEPIIGRLDQFRLPPSTDKLRKIFSGYDCYIGCGITPSIFRRIKKKLTIFYPYSTGVEWVGEDEFDRKLKKFNIETPFRKYVKRMQIQGIKDAHTCINPMTDITKDVLEKHGIISKEILIPMYYNLESTLEKYDDKFITGIISVLKDSRFKVFSHMRHYWIYDKSIHTKEGFLYVTKNNNWLINGFSKFIKAHPDSKAKLILVDWGKDANESRRLCAECGIEDYVIWLPLLKRKYITAIMSICDLSVGEFTIKDGTMWGATGWEAIACGKPILQSYNYADGEFESIFGHHPPSILNVRSENDVDFHLCEMYTNVNKRVALGDFNKKWFNDYAGISLAKKWLKILEESC